MSIELDEEPMVCAACGVALDEEWVQMQVLPDGSTEIYCLACGGDDEELEEL